MYLHLGNNKILRSRSILGIFDCDSCTSSSDTKRFLTGAQAQKKLHSLTDDVPRSFIVTVEGEIYMSLLSSSALKGRSEGE